MSTKVKPDIVLPVALFIAVISGAIGYGTLQANVAHNQDTVKAALVKIETLTEKLSSVEIQLQKNATLLEEHNKLHGVKK